MDALALAVRRFDWNFYACRQQLGEGCYSTE
jgi:hypothetical protein